MSPLVYLTARKAKNKFLELLRKPMKLIVTAGFLLLVALNFTVAENSSYGTRDFGEFKAIIFAFYILCFITETGKGFKNGGTMFTMADVNLLFLSPIKPVAILFQGMLSRLGSSLWMAFAFVYQFALLRSFYPVTLSQMLVAVVGYAVTLFLSQLAGMLVYSFCCGEKSKTAKLKAIFYSLCAIFLLVAATGIISSGELNAYSLAVNLTALPMRFFPVAGWVFSAVDGLMLGDAVKILSGAAACLVFAAVCFILLAFSKQGYYEDVVLTAEKDALNKETGKTTAEVKISSKSRNASMKGQGAVAIFYKHLLENRRSKTLFFSTTSLVYLGLIAVYAYIFKSGTVALFVMSCTASILTILAGRWVRELTMPYIYILPVSPVKKLFFMLIEMFPKLIFESIIHCALIGFICKLGAVTVIALIVARFAFGFVLMASALITARFYREKEKNNIFAAVCILLGMVFAVPSALCALPVAFYGFGLINAFLVMAAVNFAVGFILLFFARKLLDFSD